MTKKDKVLFMQDYFGKMYGEVKCSLDYGDAFQLLIATQLAAQCTDKRVNIVTKKLFAKYPTAEHFAQADLTELEQDVKSTGFFRNKAKNIIGSAQTLLSRFDGKVPDNMEDLLILPGVGRKTANLVLGDIFKQPSMVVDTHCKRITALVGLTKNTDPTKVEMDLKKIVPPEYGNEFCHQLVEHGRNICVARRPKCMECGLYEICNFAKGGKE